MMMPKTDTGSQAVTELERRKLCGEQNIRFNLEQCFLDLEYKTGNDFCKAVYNRTSTIVYAMFKGVCRICIELKPDFSVRQASVP